MARSRNPIDFIRAIADHTFPKRLAAEVMGNVNGVLTVAVEGRVSNIQYAGTDELIAGTRVWVRKVPDDPHGSYSYEGFRIQAGSVQGGEPGRAQGRVASSAVEDHVGVRVIDGTGTPVTLPLRKYLEFRGGVNVIDDPDNDKVIIEVFGGTGTPVDYDDFGVDYDDPSVGYGG